MKCNSILYDKKHDFVAKYGKGLLEFVPKNSGQAILDLGCETGILTVQLADLCNKIIGVDSSQSMIDKAKEKFGNIEFMVCDAFALTRDILWNGEKWVADYRRLRVSTHI